MRAFIISCLICVLIWFSILAIYGFMSWLKDRKRRKMIKLDYKVINRGKCMLCGKDLTEGLFFCKECEQKGKGEEA